MRQMTWEDFNPYRGINTRQIIVVLIICLFVSIGYEWVQWRWDRRIGRRQRRGRGFWMGFTYFYVYTIFCATIIGRIDGREPEMRTRLFWTLEEALQTGDWIYWYYIVGNILMFIPLGFALMHLLGSRKGRGAKSREIGRFFCTVVLCLLLSALIEGIQYVTRTGLCEADDLLHNTLGGALGGIFYFAVGSGRGTRERQ